MMKHKTQSWWTLAVVLSGFMVASAAIASEPVEVRVLSSEMSVDKSVVSIGDIAKITGANRQLRDRIAKLDLDSLNARRDSVSITRSQIQVRMVLAGISADDVRLRCPERVNVKRAAIEDFQGKVERLVRDELAQQFGLEAADVQIRLAGNEQLGNVQRSIDTTDFTAMIVFPAKLPVGDQTIRVDFSDRRGNRTSANIAMQVVVMTEVLVTRNRIPKGSVIRAEYVQTIKRPLADSTLALADVDHCIGCTAAKDIPPHEMVAASYVVKTRVSTKKLVRANDFVDVVLRKGPVTIRLKNAKVLTAGAVGDVVQVLNTNTNKRFTATVKNKTTVVVGGP